MIAAAAAAALRLGAAMVSPGGKQGRVSILIYHRVLRAPDPIFPEEVDAPAFEAQMRTLAGHCNVLPLAEAVERLRSGSLPPRAACVTFDDGYADNAEIALPILRRLGINATFFVATGFLDGGRMFNDTIIESVRRAAGEVLDLSALGLGCHSLESYPRRRAAISALLSQIKYRPLAERCAIAEQVADAAQVRLPDDLMMRSAQVKQLHDAGMAIGGHTVQHSILAQVDRDAARIDIGEGKARLESIIGAPVTLFAYPNGRPRQDYAAEHVQLVKELGFAAAVSTAWGVATAHSDFYQLPRFTPWDRSPTRFALRMLQNTLRTAPDQV